jgi:hypothetical protein
MCMLRYILFFCFFGLNLNAQELDEFTLDKEVIVFVKDKFKELKNFNLGVKVLYEDNQLYLDSIEYSPWFVGDFNDDGLSDLFITGHEKKQNISYLILAEEEGKYNYIEVRAFEEKGDLRVPFIEETKKGPLIIIKHYATERRKTIKKGKETYEPKIFSEYYKLGLVQKDTLYHRFGSLLEYNKHPVDKKLSFIQLHSFCQFGGCPDYKLKVDSVGGLIMQTIKNTREDAGYYKSTCDESDLRLLQNLCKNLKLESKSPTFGSSENSDQVITCFINFTDGTSYKISDYAKGGNYTLSAIYELVLGKIKESAIW